MCVKLNSLFDSEMKVYYVTQDLKQCINIKTMCPYYKVEFRNINTYLLQVSLGAWAKIERVIEMSVKLMAIVIIVSNAILLHIV